MKTCEKLTRYFYVFIIFVRVSSGTIQSFKISVKDLMFSIFLAIVSYTR